MWSYGRVGTLRPCNSFLSIVDTNCLLDGLTNVEVSRLLFVYFCSINDNFSKTQILTIIVPLLLLFWQYK